MSVDLQILQSMEQRTSSYRNSLVGIPTENYRPLVAGLSSKETPSHCLPPMRSKVSAVNDPGKLGCIPDNLRIDGIDYVPTSFVLLCCPIVGRFWGIQNPNFNFRSASNSVGPGLHRSSLHGIPRPV